MNILLISCPSVSEATVDGEDLVVGNVQYGRHENGDVTALSPRSIRVTGGAKMSLADLGRAFQLAVLRDKDLINRE